MKTLIFAVIVLASQFASAATPKTLSIIFSIEGNRSTRSSAVAISPDYILTCSHAIRDDRCNLGEVVEVHDKYDWAIILADNDKKNTTWSELRDTPLKVGEIVYFNGGTARVRKDGFLDVLSGQIIHGMSGGPIWDKDGKVFSVISEYYIEAKILYGYYAANWVREELGEGLSTCSPKPTVSTNSDERLSHLIAVRDRLKALVETKGLTDGATGGLPEPLGTAPEAPIPADPPEALSEAPTAENGHSEGSLPLPVQSDTTVPTLRDKIQAYASRGGVAYYEGNGRNKTSLRHMVNVHRWSMAELKGLSQRELDLLHGMSHTKKIKPGPIIPAVQDAVPEAVAAVPKKAQPQTGKGYWKKVCHGTWCELVWVPTN